MPEEKTVIFVSNARGHMISGFVKEKKQAGIIDVPEVPIVFTDHFLTTSDKNIAKFVRESGDYKRGKIREFEDMTAAMKYRLVVEKKMMAEQEGKIDNSYTEKVEFKNRPAEDIAAAMIPER